MRWLLQADHEFISHPPTDSEVLAGVSCSDSLPGVSLCQYHQVRASAKSLPSCLILCYSVVRSLPGFPVHGILQARIREWVATASSRGSSWSRDWTRIPHAAGGSLAAEPPRQPLLSGAAGFTSVGHPKVKGLPVLNLHKSSQLLSPKLEWLTLPSTPPDTAARQQYIWFYPSKTSRRFCVRSSWFQRECTSFHLFWPFDSFSCVHCIRFSNIFYIFILGYLYIIHFKSSLPIENTD